jgi:hypothetical protein
MGYVQRQRCGNLPQKKIAQCVFENWKYFFTLKNTLAYYNASVVNAEFYDWFMDKI